MITNDSAGERSVREAQERKDARGQGAAMLAQVQKLDEIIEAYHGREGTFNFHYSHFDLLSWRVWVESHGLTRADYDRMEIEDYAVVIAHQDNSMSYDSYCVLLKDILEWYDGQID